MLVLLTMMVPFQVMMIPLFLESNLLGLLDTYGGLILPKATSAFGIFMMRSYSQHFKGSGGSGKSRWYE